MKTYIFTSAANMKVIAICAYSFREASHILQTELDLSCTMVNDYKGCEAASVKHEVGAICTSYVEVSED